jgi:hypothetical protein
MPLANLDPLILLEIYETEMRLVASPFHSGICYCHIELTLLSSPVLVLVLAAASRESASYHIEMTLLNLY